MSPQNLSSFPDTFPKIVDKLLADTPETPPPDFTPPTILPEATSIPLWRVKNPHIAESAEYDVDPVGLQHVLVYLVSKLDVLTAKFDELESKNNIMQSSLFTSLSNSMDSKFGNFRNDVAAKLREFSTEAIIDQCADICNTMQNAVEKKIEDLTKQNEDTRKVWDDYMSSFRDRVLEGNRVDISKDEVGDDELDHADLQYLDHKMAEFSDKIDTLMKENHKFDQRLVKLEQYTRRESLVFEGIPSEIPQEFLQRTVLQIMFNLGFNLGPDDISACHRLWSPPGSTEPPKVVVKFVNRKIVEWSLDHQENLQWVKHFMGLDLKMSPSLCAKNTESHNICKWLKDKGVIHHFFMRNGFAKIIVKKGGNAVKITHPDHIRKRFSDAGIPDVFP